MPDPFERLGFFQRNKSDRDTERTFAKIENYAQGNGDEKSYLKDMGEIAYLLRTRDLEAEMLAEVLPFIEARKDLGKVEKAVKYMRETTKNTYSATSIQKIVQQTADKTAKKTIQEFVIAMKSAEAGKSTEKPKEKETEEKKPKEKPEKENTKKKK